MKKIFTVFAVFSLFCISAFSATKTGAAPINKNLKEQADGSILIDNIDKDGSAVKFNQKVDNFTGVTIVTGSKVTKKNPVNVDLQDLGNKEIELSVSCDIKIDDPSGKENEICWMIDDLASNLPTVVREQVPAGKWKTISGSIIIPLSEKRNLYVSAFGLDVKNIKIYLKNIQIVAKGDDLTANAPEKEKMSNTSVTLKDAYKNYFDYIGLACEFKKELNNPDTLEGIEHQVNYITLGNEFKPDYLFGWKTPNTLVDFVAEDGNTYQMPSDLPVFNDMRTILNLAKAFDFKIRGHVLVWHSQTPVWFFKEDFKNSKDAPYVDRATMTAREEWYIKSVLEYVNNWEQTYNKGKHIVFVWDVVNEACADGASETKWLRENSDWYKVFHDETFIINAFRYANKYAPSDVLLAYNDYNTYSGIGTKSGGKNGAVLRLIDEIKATPDARIDVVGMQSHVSMNSPKVTGPGSFEAAVQSFLDKGVDVQITELDIANGKDKYSSIRLKAKYKEYFTMFLNNRKKDGKNGIQGVTIWGLRDEGTWLNSQEQYRNLTQYPLLFEGRDYECKPAFYGVIEAAQNYKEN